MSSGSSGALTVTPCDRKSNIAEPKKPQKNIKGDLKKKKNKKKTKQRQKNMSVSGWMPVCAQRVKKEEGSRLEFASICKYT